MMMQLLVNWLPQPLVKSNRMWATQGADTQHRNVILLFYSWKTQYDILFSVLRIIVLLLFTLLFSVCACMTPIISVEAIANVALIVCNSEPSW